MSEVEPRPDAGQERPRVLTRKTLIYRFVRTSVDLTYRIVFRRRVEGRENLPMQGPVLLALNHQSFLDIPLVAGSTTRHVSFVARESLARSRPLGWLMRQCGAVLIQRGKPDRAALREMVAHLEAGDCVAVFPEGTRSSDGRLQPFRAGALLAARLSGAPVVPAAIRGTIEAWPRGARWPRPRRVSLSFAPAVDPNLPDALERVRAGIEERLGDGRFPAT
jgi:1-acyl-sn-glycerol-3-phosphate acyltransferase